MKTYTPVTKSQAIEPGGRLIISKGETYVGFHQAGLMEQYLSDDNVKFSELPRKEILPLYRGMYVHQLSSWRHYFPLRRFHFIKSEDMYGETQQEMDRLMDWLRLPRFKAETKRVDKREASCDIREILNSTETQLLGKFYRNVNEGLEKITGFGFE